MSNLKKYSNGKCDATKAIQKLLDQRGLVENVYRNETFCKETLTTVENNSDCEYSL